MNWIFNLQSFPLLFTSSLSDCSFPLQPLHTNIQQFLPASLAVACYFFPVIYFYTNPIVWIGTSLILCRGRHNLLIGRPTTFIPWSHGYRVRILVSLFVLFIGQTL